MNVGCNNAQRDRSLGDGGKQEVKVRQQRWHVSEGITHAEPATGKAQSPTVGGHARQTVRGNGEG